MLQTLGTLLMMLSVGMLVIEGFPPDREFLIDVGVLLITGYFLLDQASRERDFLIPHFIVASGSIVQATLLLSSVR